jgi:hypothetical protein
MGRAQRSPWQILSLCVTSVFMLALAVVRTHSRLAEQPLHGLSTLAQHIRRTVHDVVAAAPSRTASQMAV